MSAVASGLRWFGTLLVNAADELETAPSEPIAAPPDCGIEVEEDLRRMRERVARAYY